MKVVTVAVDANGADLGPREVAAGAAVAAKRGVRVLLYGPASELGTTGDWGPGVEVIDSPVSIAKAANPAAAARSTPEASIVRAARAVANGEADTFVSGGSFAYMGAALAHIVLGVAKPRVALLSNGEEATRGSPLVIEVHERLAAATGLNFVGNVEGTALTDGVADVIVTDGFTGNVALKVMEGVSGKMMASIRARATSTTRAKAGGLLLKPALREFRDEIDPEGSGGAYLLGLRGLSVIAHGSSSRVAIRNAILHGAHGARNDVVQRLTDQLGRGARAAAEAPAG